MTYTAAGGCTAALATGADVGAEVVALCCFSVSEKNYLSTGTTSAATYTLGNDLFIYIL